MPHIYTPQRAQLPPTPPEYLYPEDGHVNSANSYSIQPLSMGPPWNTMVSSASSSAIAPITTQRPYDPRLPPGLSGDPYYHSGPAQRELPPLVPGMGSAAETQREWMRQEQRDPEPEQKTSGGLSPNGLEYDLDTMTDFFAEYARGITTYSPEMQHVLISQEQRRFVHSVLSATRLPTSTLILALAYLRERMSTNISGISDNYNMLVTVSLMLASKFLDDNTFQNKSWAEVTHIPVGEINDEERKWLLQVRWTLHLNPDEYKGFNQYTAAWKQWSQKLSEREAWSIPVAPLRQRNAPVLAPIDTNLKPRGSIGGMEYPYVPRAYAPPTPYTPSNSSIGSDGSIRLPPPGVDAASMHWYRMNRTPPSAPPTGPTTPEAYYGYNGYGGAPPVYQQQERQPCILPPIIPHSSPSYGLEGACNCRPCWEKHYWSGNRGMSFGQPIAVA